MAEARKLAAILAAGIVGYSRLTQVDEDRTLARIRALRSDLIHPTIAVHHGRIVKRTGDGAIVEFRSVVDAVAYAREIQNGMIDRNAGVPEDERILFRIGVHAGDVVEESDGDLMSDGVNIAARLEGIAKPGAVCISEDAYRHVKGRLDVKINDLGLTPLKNIAEPVHVYSLEVGAPGGMKRSKSARPSGASWLRPALAAFLTIVVVVAVGLGWRSGLAARLFGVAQAADKLASAPRFSIVVLPFANLSSDPEQEYFADAIVDDLTTDLSHISGSFVIARNTAFTYKNKAVDVNAIGRELGVRYALEGSARRTGDTVSINAQFISTETGAHVWADRFDGERSELGHLRVEVVSRLANALGLELIRAEALRAIRERPSNPDAVALAMRGRVIYWQFNPVSNKLAVDYFERA